jgi:ribosomal protein S18 acetylase RimI-like enzyme
MQIYAIQTQDEADMIARLAQEIWHEHYKPIIGEQQVAYMLEKFQSADQIWTDIKQNGYVYNYIIIGSQAAAYMAYREEDISCFLSKLYVKKQFRGQKLARLLIDHLVSCCQDNKRKEIYLTVNKNNDRSIAAYKKMMFKIERSVITDIGNGFVMDDYIMRRSI